MASVRNLLIPASGHGRFWKTSAKTIRFAKQGCTNRPFFQIVVMEVENWLNFYSDLINNENILAS